MERRNLPPEKFQFDFPFRRDILSDFSFPRGSFFCTARLLSRWHPPRPRYFARVGQAIAMAVFSPPSPMLLSLLSFLLCDVVELFRAAAAASALETGGRFHRQKDGSGYSHAETIHSNLGKCMAYENWSGGGMNEVIRSYSTFFYAHTLLPVSRLLDGVETSKVLPCDKRFRGK